jgi:hypothetical protein
MGKRVRPRFIFAPCSLTHRVRTQPDCVRDFTATLYALF